jgi:LPS sulfotransferase NodH
VFAFTDGARVVGFKLLSRQDDLLLVSLLLNRRVRKVVLHRRHWLEQYVSQLVAEKTNIWSQVDPPIPQGAGAPEPVRVRVEVPELLRFIRKRKFFYRCVRGLTTLTRQPAFELAYEDLDDPALIRRMLEFLGVDPHVSLATRTVRQRSHSLRDRVENFDQVRQDLLATRYSYLV